MVIAGPNRVACAPVCTIRRISRRLKLLDRHYVQGLSFTLAARIPAA